MHISIGIPTWNRAGVLKRTLFNLKRLNIPAGVTFEILVVDNKSTDKTQDVINLFQNSLPLIPLFEPAQGKSYALNCAIKAAKGDYIIWIDDDILVNSNWLTEYYNAFINFPNSGIFGGRIIPYFEGSPPKWLISSLPVIGGVYGMCDPKEGNIELDDPFLPFGGNMAVKGKLQRSFLFDVRIGRQGGKLFAGEESKLIREMLIQGIEGRWVPRAQVEHLVPSKMQTIAHIRRYFHDWGVSDSLKSEKNIKSIFFAESPWVWRQAIQCELRYWCGRILKRSPAVWMQDLRLASNAWGILRKRPMKVPK